MATNYERAKVLVGESQDHWLLAPFIEEDRVAAFEKARQAVALIEKDASADGSLSSEEGLVYVAALAFSNEDGYLPELVKDRLKPCVSEVYGIISEATLDDEGKDEWAMSLWASLKLPSVGTLIGFRMPSLSIRKQSIAFRRQAISMASSPL